MNKNLVRLLKKNYDNNQRNKKTRTIVKKRYARNLNLNYPEPTPPANNAPASEWTEYNRLYAIWKNYQEQNTNITSTFNAITTFDNSSDKTYSSAKLLLTRIIREYNNIEKNLKSIKDIISETKTKFVMYNQSVVAVPYDNEHFFNYSQSGGVESFINGIDTISKKKYGTEYMFTPVTDTSLKTYFEFTDGNKNIFVIRPKVDSYFLNLRCIYDYITDMDKAYESTYVTPYSCSTSFTYYTNTYPTTSSTTCPDSTTIETNIPANSFTCEYPIRDNHYSIGAFGDASFEILDTNFSSDIEDLLSKRKYDYCDRLADKTNTRRTCITNKNCSTTIPTQSSAISGCNNYNTRGNERSYYRSTPTTIYFSKELLDLIENIVLEAEKTIAKFKLQVRKQNQKIRV